MAILSTIIAFISANWKVIMALLGGMAISNILQSISRPPGGNIIDYVGAILTPMMSMMFMMMFMSMFMKMFNEMLENIEKSI